MLDADSDSLGEVEPGILICDSPAGDSHPAGEGLALQLQGALFCMYLPIPLKEMQDPSLSSCGVGQV